MVWQQPLPGDYRSLSEADLRVRAAAAREKLGKRLVILGHHYQQDSVIELADFVGDSFELSQKAAQQQGIEFVIFCGVHFMAESADILTDSHVKVILPDLGAGCSMADMANLDQTLDCWAQLTELCPDQRIVPITYMNSSAAIKAFVGEHGGAVCTSSNCAAVLQWALRGGASNAAPGQKVKILFFPDQHLGRNTASAMGYPQDSMVVWDPQQDLGGNTPPAAAGADFVLWKGHCSVHQLFRPEHVAQVRQKYPNMKVIVHPECRREVVQQADQVGSTAYIVNQITRAPAGSEWAVGTEVHLVARLAKQHPEQKIIVLSDCQCLCTTMFRIDLAHLCWTMENLAQGKIVNQIKVDDQTRKWALVALDRMLSIKGRPNPGAKNQPVTVD
ncbi:MAG: quinolinate synthase NadA [Tepidisphaeraceae bacterium]